MAYSHSKINYFLIEPNFACLFPSRYDRQGAINISKIVCFFNNLIFLVYIIFFVWIAFIDNKTMKVAKLI